MFLAKTRYPHTYKHAMIKERYDERSDDMSCPIDHTVEEVGAKLEEQKPFLPTEIYEGSAEVLQVEQTQKTLNELFHLLKKYDLADEEERKNRDASFHAMFAK